jgi:arylsulfatase A-like enzyme
MWWFVSGALAAPNVILISLDTTRVDAISAYGVDVGPTRWERVTTPRLDALAADGARFERFWTNAPTTLNAHATMFTGLDPHEHAVVRNGYPFEVPGPTLATRLSGLGYDTIAVLGSAALEGAMGLNRGFRVYDDRMPELQSIMFQDRAEGVVARALEHVDARQAGAPLFLFAHFYDAHAPYDPPPRHRDRFVDPEYPGDLVAKGRPFMEHTRALRKDEADPHDVAHVGALYLAEVAYVDEQVGVLLDALAARGLLDEALVVVTADHGETLADDPMYAYSHGSNVEEDVMHVPLIVRGYGMPVAERAVIRSQAAMPGLAPTIERLLGHRRTLGEHPDFYDLLRDGPVHDEDGWPERPTHVAYFEASRPRVKEDPVGWNNLPLHRGVAAGGYGFWTVPFLPKEPPAWLEASAPGDAAVYGVLVDLLARWDADVPEHRDEVMAPATDEALKVLGYVE